MVFFWRTRTMRAHHVPTDTNATARRATLSSVVICAAGLCKEQRQHVHRVCSVDVCTCISVLWHAGTGNVNGLPPSACVFVSVLISVLCTHTHVQPLSAPERVQSRQSERNRTMYKHTSCTHMHSNQFQSQFTTRPGPDNCCAQLRSGCG